MKNRIILLITVFLCIINKSHCQNNLKYNIDSLFSYHFKVLDSIANNNFIDSTMICIESIKFMELNTKINSSTDGNYFGKTSFNKNDIKSWRIWYNRNKRELYWCKKDRKVKIEKDQY